MQHGLLPGRRQVLSANEQVGQQRHDGDRNHKGGKQRVGHGHPKGQEEVADHPAHQADGEKDDHCGDGGSEDRDCHVAGAVNHRPARGVAPLDVAVDVLQHYDAVVHHAADGDGHAGEGHDVEGGAGGEDLEQERDDGADDGHVFG